MQAQGYLIVPDITLRKLICCPKLKHRSKSDLIIVHHANPPQQYGNQKGQNTLKLISKGCLPVKKNTQKQRSRKSRGQKHHIGPRKHQHHHGDSRQGKEAHPSSPSVLQTCKTGKGGKGRQPSRSADQRKIIKACGCLHQIQEASKHHSRLSHQKQNQIRPRPEGPVQPMNGPKDSYHCKYGQQRPRQKLRGNPSRQPVHRIIYHE